MTSETPNHPAADTPDAAAPTGRSGHVWDFPAQVAGQVVVDALPFWVTLPIAALFFVGSPLAWTARELRRIAQHRTAGK